MALNVASKRSKSSNYLEVNQLLVLEFKNKSSKLHEVLLAVALQNKI